MDVLDPSEEWRRLTELYRQMTDGELLAIAQKKFELTEHAQPILIQEVTNRRLEIPPDVPPPLTPREPDAEDPYTEDRKLVTICSVRSMADALQVQRLLDTAGIPFFMGAEKATGIDQVTSNFEEGIDVQIIRIGMPWARQAMQHYEPLNDPDWKESEFEDDDLAIHCPKCHSTEIVFGDESAKPLAQDGTEKFRWTCDSCGHRWEDDGVQTE